MAISVPDRYVLKSTKILPSVADPLIAYATTSFAINHKSCTGPTADRLPMHDRGSGTEGRES